MDQKLNYLHKYCLIMIGLLSSTIYAMEGPAAFWYPYVVKWDLSEYSIYSFKREMRKFEMVLREPQVGMPLERGFIVCSALEIVEDEQSEEFEEELLVQPPNTPAEPHQLVPKKSYFKRAKDILLRGFRFQKTRDYLEDYLTKLLLTH